MRRFSAAAFGLATAAAFFMAGFFFATVFFAAVLTGTRLRAPLTGRVVLAADFFPADFVFTAAEGRRALATGLVALRGVFAGGRGFLAPEIALARVAGFAFFAPLPDPGLVFAISVVYLVTWRPGVIA
ncbi:MAG TPA: hypothetical protein VFG55_04625 [Rhodanobacteraceae bacterium]|nr:hypothetical protein [Rhodanobacteraceae bacterium]